MLSPQAPQSVFRLAPSACLGASTVTHCCDGGLVNLFSSRAAISLDPAAELPAREYASGARALLVSATRDGESGQARRPLAASTRSRRTAQWPKSAAPESAPAWRPARQRQPGRSRPAFCPENTGPPPAGGT